MNDQIEPMTSFTEDEWLHYKRATRNLQHRRRMDQGKEADQLPWLLAVERDDRMDPAERELVIEERAA